jgi:glycosyltransferase involved in cell wall biosynthesis
MTSRTSVIMPVRNGERFIEEALVSVLPQIALDDEIIVVDDGSTDATRSMLARVADPRIRVLNGVGCGASSARNIGLAAAVGEFIGFIDHDDLWPAGRHRAMMQAMAGDPQLDAVFGRIRIRLDPGAIQWPWLRHQDGCHAPGSNLGNALYRSAMLRRIDGFDESLRFGEDLEYFNRLRQLGLRFALCDVDAMIYRRHTTNISNDERAMRNMVFDFIKRKKAETTRLRSRAGGEP